MLTKIYNSLPVKGKYVFRRVRNFFFRIKREGFLKPIIGNLYQKYVNEVFVPDNSEIIVQRYPMTHGKKWGKIGYIKITHNQKEEYLFDFEHKISEDDNGIIYLAGRAQKFDLDSLYELQEQERGQSSS